MPDVNTQNTAHPPFTPIRRFWRLATAQRKDITSIYLFAIVAGIISLSLPLGIQAIFNFVTTGQVTTSWVILIAVVIIGVVVNGGLQIFQLYVTERIQQRIFTHSAIEFAYRIPRLRLEAVRNQVVPELVNRFFDTLTVQKGFSKILLDFSASSLQILFGLLLLSFYHPFFILFSVLLLGLLYLVLRSTGPAGLRTSLEESKYKYKVVFWLEEMGRTLDSFKLAGSSRLPLEKTDSMIGKYLDARNRHFKVLAYNYGLILGFKILTIAGLLVIGSLLVFQNELNVGQFVAMEIVVILLLSALDKLILTTEVIYDVLTALEKLGSLTDLPLESGEGQVIPRSGSHDGISIAVTSLTLKFPDLRHPILQDVNLRLKPGDKVQIVTYDDSLITHLFRLLMGFYEGYEGQISYNGMPLQNLSLEDLRDHSGGYSTLQEIFDGTLLENITVGMHGIPMERILRIMEVIGLMDFAHAEKQGINMPLHTGGAHLPVSIRLKIILARSIATHPQLLLLNNPFQGLTHEEGERFMDYVTQHMPTTTMILATPQPIGYPFVHPTYQVAHHTLVPVETT